MVCLVAFDLDGTLVRGPAVNCGAIIAEAFGHLEWIERMEPLNMRGETPEQMSERIAPWVSYSRDELCRPREQACLAPAAEEAFRVLQGHGVATAIVSLAFDFVVGWFVRRFNADYWAASRFDLDGSVTPLWPEDKGPWLRELSEDLGLAGARLRLSAIAHEARSYCAKPVMATSSARSCPRSLHLLPSIRMAT